METEYEVITIDGLSEEQLIIVDILISEGRLREREEIIEQLMTLYNITCCCDSAKFGDHYLSHKQPDNIIDLIKNRSNSEQG